MSALNIIDVSFKSGSHSARTKKIYQYAYGQIYNIQDLDLPPVFNVDFSNTPEIGDSKPYVGMDNQVEVPNEYWGSGAPVYAFIVLHEGENDGRTVYTIVTPVQKRPKPSNVQPTPVQQNVIDQIIAAFNVIAGRAELAVEHYPYISEEDTWVIWDVNDEEWVDTGIKARGEDGYSPTITVEDITDGHKVVIEDATGTKTFDVMDGEKGDPGNPGVSPIITIVDITGGHRVIIEDAEGTTVFNVMDGAPGNDGYSPTVTISDITGGHTVTIRDKNGDHSFNVMDGQDYVLTQADKEEIASMVDLSDYAKKTDLDGKVDKVTGKSLSTNDYTTEEKNKLSGIEAQANKTIVDDALSNTSTNPVQNKKVKEALDNLDAGDIAYDDTETYDEGTVGDGLSSVKAEINQLQNGKADIIISNASGTIASFTDGAEYDAVGLTAEFAPYQEGSGDASPENVRPISGWTGLDIFCRNRNLLQVTADSKTQAGVTWTVNADGTITVSGTATGYSTLSIGQAVIEGIKDKTVCISGLSEVTNVVWDTFVLYYKNGSQIASLTISSASDKTIDLSQYSGVHHITINAKRASNVATSGTIRPKVEFGSSSTPYIKLNGTTTPISWQTEAGEVFGGYVDVVKGKLVVDRVLETLDGSQPVSDNGIQAYGGIQIKYTPRQEKKYASDQQHQNEGIISDKFDSLEAMPSTAYKVTGRSTSGNIFFNMPPDITTAQEARTWFGNNPTQISYLLATPIEYDIDPVTIELLKGYNNVWSSAGGNVDVEYRADTKLYLDAHAPKVDDVQVNGTSIVSQGVANVPIADDTTIGVAKFGATYGVAIGSGGQAYVSQATSAQVKAGTAGFRPIAPERQHESTFYGLAKAASDTTQSASSNPVGTYTDAAKVAIQKMLGIYEAPWELIREDTVTNANEANIEITVDGNGQPFELTDIRIMFCTPVQEAAVSVGEYGRVRAYYNSSIYDIVYLGGYSQTAGSQQRTSVGAIEQRGGMIQRFMMQADGNNSSVNVKSRNSYSEASHSSIWEYIGNTRVYNKIVIMAITGTAQYKLYGKRKWS